MESVEQFAKSDSNVDDLSLIQDGLTKQHFIELEPFLKLKGDLYEKHLITNEWKQSDHPVEKKRDSVPRSESQQEDIFTTEVSQRVLENARKRLSSSVMSLNQTPLLVRQKNSINEIDSQQLLSETPDQIKEHLHNRAMMFYEKAFELFEEEKYEQTIVQLKKAFSLDSFNVQFYLLKCEAFIQLCDFNSAISTLNKLISILSLYTHHGDTDYDKLKKNIREKITFCYYMLGQTYLDNKLYVNALEAFSKASELMPNILNFKVRSVVCLFSMDRIQDSIEFLSKIIEESEENKVNPNLFILRARLYLKQNETNQCYLNIKYAQTLDPQNKEILSLIDHLETTADDFRTQSLILSLSNRVQEALIKMNSAISFNPTKVEYHLQRGVLYKRLKNFNAAIDDFLLGLQKLEKQSVNTSATTSSTTADSNLFANFQRQILLTYNDFAIECYEKGFFDDAIVLLNKAIKIEKNEKGFYLNRGDCYMKKNNKKYALLDYEQANELDSKDEKVKTRIAKIYYDMGIEAYNEKNYQEASTSFTKAIKFSPKNCAYYISRARILHLLDKKHEAQFDICISILLDPTNTEIPSIVSRVFVNQNLDDVLQSVQMKGAMAYLESKHIESVFDVNKRLVKEEKKKEVNHVLNQLQKKLNEYQQEQEENMKLVESKKKLSELMKNTEMTPDLKSKKPILAPIELKTSQSSNELKKANSKGVNWRKFNSGIGSFT